MRFESQVSETLKSRLRLEKQKQNIKFWCGNQFQNVTQSISEEDMWMEIVIRDKRVCFQGKAQRRRVTITVFCVIFGELSHCW